MGRVATAQEGGSRGAAPAAMEDNTMRKIMMLAAATAATALTTPALAGSAEGKFQVKVLGTAVLPDGGIDKIKHVDAGLAGVLGEMGVEDIDTKASDNVVPTLAVEYFFTKNVSVETICCFTQHHVNGAADLEGTNLVNHVLILPATVTAKFHLDTGGVALQGGVDIALGDSGFGLSIDAKKYFVKPTAKFYVDGAKVLETKHNLDPWVLSAGLAYRF